MRGEPSDLTAGLQVVEGEFRVLPDDSAGMVALTINGARVTAKTEATVLEAARGAGIYIPSLCYYSDLEPLPGVVPDMACQLCVVEIDGRVTLSCNTKVAQGMSVETETPRVQQLRRRSLTDIMRRHPSACIACNRLKHCGPNDICLRNVGVNERCVLCPRNENCELQEAWHHIGVEELPAYTPRKLPVRQDSPFFIRDNNYCILCQRCVRVCESVRGARAIEFAYPCHRACPAGIDIPRYIRLIGRGRPDAALAVIREKVPFPGVLGRVCIHPCEAACQRGLAVDKPLQIRMLKRFAADNGDDSWKRQARKLPPSGKSVAVVGSGPAGLTAAYYLAKLGHKITVFEALPKPGGMMLVGIPAYRLPRRALDDEIEEVRNAGVEMKFNSRIKSVDSLFDQGYDAVFLGLGAHQGIRLGVAGEDLPGVIESVEFLRRGNLGERINVGERVGVVGGGNVAIDAARMSLRFGAKKVTIFYRRTRNEMPASAEEIDAALKEGVEIIYLVAPSNLTRQNNTLKLECTRMMLGAPDASGRARPVPIEGSEFATELDTLLVAIGQRLEVPSELRVEVDRGNVIKVNSSMETTRKGVFSGGDCVSGPASVIEAIADGRKAAQAIDRYLGGKGDISESLVVAEESEAWPEEALPEEKMAAVSHLPAETSARSFDEVELAWDSATARAEAQRCLRCYVIAPPDDKVLKDANCQFCGACADACPTGALVERGIDSLVRTDREIRSVCPYCGVGCGLLLGTHDQKLVTVHGDRDNPVNNGQLCVKGRFGIVEFVNHSSRLQSPLIKKDGKFVKATWEEAIDLVASKLAKYRGDQFAAISSAKCPNEDNYVFQKFTRAVMGTNSIDHCARLCHSPTVAGLATTFGSGAMTNSISEIKDAACIFAIGSNTTDTHPIIGLEAKKAAKRGAKIIVANPRQIELCQFADVWLRHLPGTDVALLMGIMRVIVEEGLLDRAFIEQRCENYDAFKESLKAFTPEFVEKTTRVPWDQVVEAARIYATNKPASILYAMGITQHAHGTDNVIATADLAMLTGNVGKRSSGVNPLRGQNNVQGACDMGALPNVYPAYQSVADPTLKAKFEAAWGCALSATPGLTLTEILDAAHRHEVKALYIIGENPVLSEPSAKHVEEALEALDFLVVQDIFKTETARFADVVLPAASFAERDGTFTNTERRVQRVRKAIEPVGESRADWQIICQVAQKLGAAGFEFSSPAEIMEEIADLAPSYGGIIYGRLDNGSLQWPCPTTDHPGTPTLHSQQFTIRGGKGKFMPLQYRPPLEAPDADYPLLLTTRRSRFHYHTGTMTRKVKGLNILRAEELVEINPEDADTLGIIDGEMVRVTSRRGAVSARARVTDFSPAGVVSMTFHFAESPSNLLTNPGLDPQSKIPELKVCAVRVEKDSRVPADEHTCSVA